MTTHREDGSTISSGVTPGGSGGTVHAGGGDISSGFKSTPGGTVHGGGPDITSGMHGASPASAGISLNIGDPIIINSITYKYEGVISKSTGEAEIFLLSHNSKKCVFKLYYPNFKPKEDIVKQLKQINHDDIINVLDYGYYHDRFFEIMDYAEGGTIEKHLPIKDISRVKRIIAETVNAFKFCHSNGIIHKDIKPQNLYYKNADGTDILIGDFGISSILETGMSRHLTSQSLTVGYAAPEMYGIGGKAYVGKEVDYYALGITIIHIWDGRNPFDGLNIHAIGNLTTSGKIHISEDMTKELQKLVKGLITVDYTKRWGYEEIQRWLKGEDVPIHFQIKEISYPPYQFSPTESATTAEELAGILKQNQDKGKKHLYSGKLSAWVNLFNQGLAVELDRIIEDDYPKDQDAGLQKAIYILDADAAYIHGGKEYRTASELADAIEEDFFHYTSAIVNPNHPFYLYLEAHDAKKEADTFRKYLQTFSAKKALNTIILELRGRDSFKLGGELFFTTEELLKYKDQKFLVKELKDTESILSLWIEGSVFHEIKKQVEKWRTLDWQDEISIAYALSQKNNQVSAKDKLTALNDEYVVPGDMNRALQSDDPWIFFAGVDQLSQLQNAKTLIEKSEYQSIVKSWKMPQSILHGVNSENFQEYKKSVERMKQLKSLSHVAYENLNNYLLPKELTDGLASDDYDVFDKAIKKLNAIDPIKLTLADYKKYTEEYYWHNELTNGLKSNDYDIHADSLKKYRDLESRNLLITKKEYQQLKNKYSIPKYIHRGITEGNKVDLYINAVQDLRELQKSGKLKTKVQVLLKNVLRIAMIISLIAGIFAIYTYIRYIPEKAWLEANKIGTFDGYAEYYLSYPNGIHADEAKTLLTNKFNTFIDYRDKQQYKIVVLGSQIWMTENLNYDTKNGHSRKGGISEMGSSDGYGRVYTYTVAPDVCPTGWHPPSVSEWETLIENLGGMNSAGKAMLTGPFKALMAGWCGEKSCGGVNLSTAFWAYRKDRFGTGYFLDSEAQLKSQIGLSDGNGLSIRCIKN